MRMPHEIIHVCLLLMQLLDLVRPQCPALRPHFDTVHATTTTPLMFCAVPTAGVKQSNNTTHS